MTVAVAVAVATLAAAAPGGGALARAAPPPQDGGAGRGTMPPPSPTHPISIVGHAPRVIDGDTLEVRDDEGHPLKIRLAGIDAPEREQPHGDAARLQLATLAGEGPLRLRIVKRDRYGRSVADAWRGDVNLAQAMLDAGLAWHFRRYAAEQPRRQRQAYAQAEIEARVARLGLWAQPAPEAPWDWRRARWQAARGTSDDGVETISGGRRGR